MIIAKKTSKNQITLPKRIVQQIPRAEYFEVSLRGGEIVLKPVKLDAAKERLEKVRETIKSLGLTEKDIQRAIRWARSQKV